MPVWRDATKQWVKDDRLVVLGIIQEQHAERCQLYAQWQQLDWPILHDPLNLFQNNAVPIMVAVDEHGIVRSTRPKLDTFEANFLDVDFPPPDEIESVPTAETTKAAPPDLAALRDEAAVSKSASAWQCYADAQTLWGASTNLDQAIDAYQAAIRSEPDNGNLHFRLGTAYRLRYDSSARRTDDFQAAADHWNQALAFDLNQYIWRRRIQQYGPRLIKPYPFYDWVETARREIEARGEKPVDLQVLLSGSEIAGPSRRLDSASATDDNKDGEPKPPDPERRIQPDLEHLIRTEVAVVPAAIKPGETVRAHVTFRPNVERQAHWNNESEPLMFWLDLPDGYRASSQLVSTPQGAGPVSTEPRQIELEIQAADDASGEVKLAAYALYYACEDAGGTCLFLRQDVPITIQVRE